jgi:predicted dehydrogenase
MLPDAEIAAVADDDEARGRDAAARFGGDFYHDYRDLLARDDIDAVIVTSPNALHSEMVIAAATARKHVFCEKPIATRRSDALAMLAACRENGVHFQTAFPMRFSPPAITLRQMVHEGAIGTPLSVIATNPGQLPPGWFSDPELAGGGAVMDHTVHVADLLRWIFEQEITSVYAEIDSRIHPNIPTDDIAILMLKLEGGLPVSLDPSWRRSPTWPTWGGLTMEVIGDKGVLSMDAFSQNLTFVDDRSKRISYVPWGEDANLELVGSFVEAIRNGTEPLVTGEDGLRALEVALCAYESARRLEPVACPDCLFG